MKPKWSNNFQRSRHISGVVVKELPLLLLSLTILFPLYFMVTNSFKVKDEYFQNMLSLPSHLTFGNYIKILQNPLIGSWLTNSVLLTFGSVLLTTIIAVLAAYAFAQMHFPHRDSIFNFIVPLMAIPPVVILIPMFVLFAKLHMVNNLISPLIIYAGLNLPFTIYLLRNFFVTIPGEIKDAAMIDGCTEFQVLSYIYVPLTLPGLVTSIVVNVVWVWNELLIALVFLQTEELRTLTVGITTSLQKRFSLDVPSLMAGLMIATIPMIILYFIGQNALVRGLTSGYEK